MKIYSYILSCAGFILQYIIPIVLFGNVIPYVHGSLSSRLTAMGYLAVATIAIIVCYKLQNKIHEMPKGLVRALLLSLFPIGFWVLVKIGINHLLTLIVSVAQYWGYVIIFILIGRLFYIISELIYDRGDK